MPKDAIFLLSWFEKSDRKAKGAILGRKPAVSGMLVVVRRIPKAMANKTKKLSLDVGSGFSWLR